MSDGIYGGWELINGGLMLETIVDVVLISALTALLALPILYNPKRRD